MKGWRFTDEDFRDALLDALQSFSESEAVMYGKDPREEITVALEHGGVFEVSFRRIL